MAARGSERIAEILEELIVELPGRLRGSGARLSDHATSALRSLIRGTKERKANPAPQANNRGGEALAFSEARCREGLLVPRFRSS